MKEEIEGTIDNIFTQAKVDGFLVEDLIGVVEELLIDNFNVVINKEFKKVEVWVN